MNYKDSKEFVSGLALKCAAEAYMLLSRNPEPVYLWHKRGDATVSSEKPDGYELSWTERISGWKTIDQNFTIIHAILRRTPVLPEEL